MQAPDLRPWLRRLREGGPPEAVVQAFVKILPTCIPGAWLQVQDFPGDARLSELAAFEVETPCGWLFPVAGRWAVSPVDEPWYRSAVQTLLISLEPRAETPDTANLSESRDHLQALRESEARFRAMVEHFPAGAVLVSGEEILINRAVVAITGYTAAQVPTLSEWFRLLFGDEAVTVRRLWESDRLDGFQRPREVWIKRSDGVRRLVQFHAYGWEDRGVRKDVWLLNDVTERVRAVETLRESENRYRLLAE
ncbi:MAG TPA: PAS domain S-box protein, partial [Candidatus Ozemobacteraceae bacterium]|nr:PAS domain S-box protein [Candidatus Ozemobacteraceae bacterium]